MDFVLGFRFQYTSDWYIFRRANFNRLDDFIARKQKYEVFTGAQSLNDGKSGISNAVRFAFALVNLLLLRRMYTNRIRHNWHAHGKYRTRKTVFDREER